MQVLGDGAWPLAGLRDFYLSLLLSHQLSELLAFACYLLCTHQAFPCPVLPSLSSAELSIFEPSPLYLISQLPPNSYPPPSITPALCHPSFGFCPEVLSGCVPGRASNFTSILSLPLPLPPACSGCWELQWDKELGALTCFSPTRTSKWSLGLS